MRQLKALCLHLFTFFYGMLYKTAAVFHSHALLVSKNEMLLACVRTTSTFEYHRNVINFLHELNKAERSTLDCFNNLSRDNLIFKKPSGRVNLF